MTEPPAQEPKPPKVSALVVAHNRKELFHRCLESLEASEDRHAMEIVAVDNGSRDGSASLEDDFPNVRFIRLPKNFGLTKALNIAVRASTGEYLLFLHEDTEVFPEAIRILAATLDAEADAGGVCPLLLNPDGTPAPQLGSFPPDNQWRPAEARSEPYAVEYPRGAALMIRSFFIRAMRQIDERYGQFGSDAEMAMQIRRGNKKILLVPAAKARHSGGTWSSHRTADFRLGVAAFIGKYYGLPAGLKSRIGAVFSALAGFQLGQLKDLIAGQKIDGTHS